MKLYKKVFFILTQVLFIIELPLSYASCSTNSDVKLSANLLDYSINVKNKSNSEYFRVSLLDERKNLSLKTAKEYIASNFARTKIYSHYISIGSNKDGKEELKIKSSSLDCDSLDFVTTCGFNDLDYMYHMPLPLYRFEVDESGVPTYASSDTRPMSKKYEGADFPSYIPSTFADYILSTNSEKYKNYNDILDKGYLFDVRFECDGEEEDLVFSVNNIYLASDTDNWDLPTKNTYLENFYNFPLLFSKYNQNCLITNCDDIFKKYGFYYEANIRSNYGNLKFFCNGNIKSTIKDCDLDLCFEDYKTDDEKWIANKNLSNIMKTDNKKISLGMIFAIVVASLYSFLSIITFILFLRDKTKQFSLHKVFALPVGLFILGQFIFFIMFLINPYLSFLINNLYANVIILMSLFASILVYIGVKKA